MMIDTGPTGVRSPILVKWVDNYCVPKLVKGFLKECFWSENAFY